MNFFKILLDNDYTQKNTQNPECNWYGLSTYDLDNVYTKGNIQVWVMLQNAFMPLPKDKKDWDLYDRGLCKFIRISNNNVFFDKTPIFQTWSGEIPNTEIIKKLIK